MVLPIRVKVWEKENAFSSEGRTKIVELDDISPYAKELCGDYVCIEGSQRGPDNFLCDPFKPGSKTFTPCFTQGFAYYTLDKYLRDLRENLNFDVFLARRFKLRRDDRAIPATVDIPDLANAFFVHENETIEYGENLGRADGDILIHEASHWIVYIINPKLGHDYTSDGRAIHEGLSDVLTALHFDDPEICETCDGSQGMRSVENKNTLQSTDPFDTYERGKVYSRFFWSLYKEIGGSYLARSAVMLIALAQVGHYKTNTPEPKDFRAAVISATDALIREGFFRELANSGVGVDKLKTQMRILFNELGFNSYSAPIHLAAKPPKMNEEASFICKPVKRKKGGLLCRTQVVNR